MPPKLTIEQLAGLSPEVLQAAAVLSKALNGENGTKSATGTPTTHWDHGPGGLFSHYGASADLFHTRVKPTGLLSVLPAYPTMYTNPLFDFITGFQADTGSDPDGPCDDCMVAGLKKACTQTAQFGRYCRETQELDVNRIGQLLNNAETAQMRLLNPIFDGNNLTPGVARQDPLRNEVAQKIVEVGISFENLLSQQLWAGNPANNNVGGGYAEFPGLDILIGTGKVDAIDGTSCPSLDSDVKDFNYQEVCDLTPSSIVHTLTYMYRFVRKNARTMQMEPVDLRWVMREELFYELTACWPCAYLSYRCATYDTANIDPTPMFDTTEAIRMRDAMRNEHYLLIDGVKVPVLLDDGITEESDADTAELNAGEFASDIYLVPMSARGNIATLYMEYLDYRVGHNALTSGPGNMLVNDYLTSDNGMFSWTKSIVNWCVLWLAVIQPRVLLRTPHLAGRLQNVKYVPLQHTRQPFPDDNYFVDGGRTSGTAPDYYSEWNDRQ